MFRPPPRSPRTDTLFPSTPLVRSARTRRRPLRPGHRLGRGVLRAVLDAGRFDAAVHQPRLPVVGAGGVAVAEAGQRRRPTLVAGAGPGDRRSEEHTSEIQSLMRISYAVFCLKKKKTKNTKKT